MANRWELLSDVNRIASNVMETTICVPVDSVWFAGHFPGEPILPGIALVDAVYEVIARDAQDRGENVQISSLKRIKFTGPVRPGEKLFLNLTREDAEGERLFYFKIAVKDSIVCSGLITVTGAL